jgi:hypothetical protein
MADVGCSSSSTPTSQYGGEITVVLTTDLQPTKDLDAIEVEVVHHGRTQWSNVYPLGPGNTLLPATVGIADLAGDTAPLTIQVTGSLQGVPRIYREATTTVVNGVNAMLRMPLDWLCDGSAPGSMPKVKGTLGPCPVNQTCVAGACASSSVDSSKLPVYQASKIFGGASGPNASGSCFDVAACFETEAPLLQVNLNDCVGTLMNGSESGSPVGSGSSGVGSIALQLPAGSDGMCDNNGCFIVLDGPGPDGPSPDGWNTSGPNFELPTAACARVTAGAVTAIDLTTSCPQKTVALPSCGPWSSVGPMAGGGGGSDGGPTAATPVAIATDRQAVVAVTADATNAYFVDAHGLSKVPLSGGMVIPLDSGARFGMTPLVASSSLSTDGQYLYWAPAGVFTYVPLSGGNPVDSMGGPTSATSFSIVNSKVYWPSATLYGDGGESFAINTADAQGLGTKLSEPFAIPGVAIYSPSNPFAADGTYAFAAGGVSMSNGTTWGVEQYTLQNATDMPLCASNASFVALSLTQDALWGATAQGLYRCPRSPSSSGMVGVVGAVQNTTGVTSDANFVYAASATSAGFALFRITLNAQGIEQIAQTPDPPQFLVSNGTTLVWASAGASATFNLYRLTLPP